MANENEADVKGQKVTVPAILRGDAEVIRLALEGEAGIARDLIENGGLSDEAKLSLAKRANRMTVLAGMFATLAKGDGIAALRLYHAISEGF